MEHPPPPVPPEQQSDKVEGAAPKPDVASQAATQPDANRASGGETEKRDENLTPRLSTQDR